jgi:hypothetical protein
MRKITNEKMEVLKFRELEVELISNVEEVIPTLYQVELKYSACRRYDFSYTDIFDDGSVDYVYRDGDERDPWEIHLSPEGMEYIFLHGVSTNDRIFTDVLRAQKKLADLSQEKTDYARIEKEKEERKQYELLKEKYESGFKSSSGE